MKKIIASVFALCLLSFTFTGCIASNQTPKPSESSTGSGITNVRVAYFPNITHAQALVMKANHILESTLGDNYHVSWSSFNAGSSEIEAFFAGAIDIGYIGPVPAVNGNIRSHGDLTVIANAAEGGAILVKKANSAITSINDLGGKTVAIPQIGNTQHLCLLNLLSEAGLSPLSEGGTVKVVAADNANILTLFDQSHIDAALVPEPWGTILCNTGQIDILLDYDEIYMDGNYPVSLVVVRNEFMNQYPDVVEKFLQAHIDATNRINHNLRDSVVDIITEIANVTSNKLDMDVVFHSFSKTNVTSELNKEALLAFAQIAYHRKMITQLPDNSFINTSILDKLTNK